MPDRKNLELAKRTGLPDDLKILLERYPRTDWADHKNLGDMAKFWLQRHDMFRELSGVLVSTVTDYREGRMQADPFAKFFVPRLRFFLQQLHGHHTIEDQHYFPVFAAAESRLKTGFDLLDEDHHVIHDTLEMNAEKANAFLSKLQMGRDATLYAADAYIDQSETMIAMLRRHLHDEEDLIIPLILDRGEDALGVH